MSDDTEPPHIDLQGAGLILIENGRLYHHAPSLSGQKIVLLDTNNVLDFGSFKTTEEGLRRVKRGTEVLKTALGLGAHINYFFAVFEAFYKKYDLHEVRYNEYREKLKRTIENVRHLNENFQHMASKEMSVLETDFMRIVDNNTRWLARVAVTCDLTNPTDDDLVKFYADLNMIDPADAPSFTTVIHCVRTLVAKENTQKKLVAYNKINNRQNTAIDHLFLDLAIYLSQKYPIIGLTGDIKAADSVGYVRVTNNTVTFALDKDTARASAIGVLTGDGALNIDMPTLRDNFNLYETTANYIYTLPRDQIPQKKLIGEIALKSAFE